MQEIKNINAFILIYFLFLLFPDFSSLLNESEKYIFKDNWTKEFLEKLITKINPRQIIVFGRTNFNYFAKLLGILNTGIEYSFSAYTENGNKSSSNYWCFDYKKINVIGLSVNLGNPRGFSKKTLNNLGRNIMNHLE